MFFHFKEVVGVGEVWKGLARPRVKHLGDLIMVKTLFSSKRSSANECYAGASSSSTRGKTTQFLRANPKSRTLANTANLLK